MKKALLQLHGAVFLWGFTGVLGRAISLDAVLLVWYRLLITVLSLWILFYFRKKISRISKASVLKISLLGFILSLHWVCFYASIKYANVTIALTCLSTAALLSSILEPLVLGRRFDSFEILLGLFAIAGIVVIYNTHLQFSIGIGIGLISALLTVLVSVYNKKIIHDYAPEEITLYQLSGGFIGLTLLLPLNNYLVAPQQMYPTVPDWIWLLILSWICTILTFYLYIRSLKKVSAFTMNLTLTLEPVYGIILAFFFYHENKYLSNWFYLGFGLIALAVVLHTWRLMKPMQELSNNPTH
ncbi:DMT family transporter [Chitinophagaceae bacterium LB-8]|uniref:DMT family transporter n=1 Tax=Paraflavisolibacter caeni TaxID=2982496 RepID=A0A9X3BGF4_9BACT|nr:DMT family transporter [Paraflavisolibacter caeni]MCU7550794.1 DMT family transporter [Paraflavisolibacter caeni]